MAQGAAPARPTLRSLIRSVKRHLTAGSRAERFALNPAGPR